MSNLDNNKPKTPWSVSIALSDREKAALEIFAASKDMGVVGVIRWIIFKIVDRVYDTEEELFE